MPWLSIVTNSLWRIGSNWSRFKDDAHAPTLWTFDSNGFASPSNMPGTNQPRQLNDIERQQLDQFNVERMQLNVANRAAIDAIISRFTPFGDVSYNPLSDSAAYQLASDASWLADHEQGSYFYNNPANYTGLPGLEFDYQADYLYMRFTNNLNQTCLAVDYSEVNTKVSEGVSTPIVIDINMDGIETTSFLAGTTVLFDINGDGIKDRTAWLSGNDAFLAVDKNHNGKIDGIIELFGGQNRADGFANLIELDSNSDGKIDNKDNLFSELLLWQDKNIDGITDTGELLSASDSGLESINTNYISQDITNNGNIFGEVSTAIFQGEETTVIDVYFRFNKGQISNLIGVIE